MLISMALAMALQAASPPPQATAVPGGDEIIVQGMRVDRKKVRDFIRAVTEAPYEGQLGRFHAAACPAAMGLPDLQNARVVHRMRQVAAAAGIRVAPERVQAQHLRHRRRRQARPHSTNSAAASQSTSTA